MKRLEGSSWRIVLSQHLGARFVKPLALRAKLSSRTVHNLLTRGGPSASTLEAIAAVLGVAKWELLKEVEDEQLELASNVGLHPAPITDSTIPNVQESAAKGADSVEVD